MPISLFLSLLFIVFVDTVNVRSFSTQIQTSTISLMNNGNGNSGPSAVTFLTAKTNVLYKYAISLQELFQYYKQDEYSLIITLSSLTTSQMTIAITTVQPNAISGIRVRYVIVQSSFSYVTTAHLAYSSTGFPLVSGTPIIQTISLPSAMNLTSVVMGFINGFDIIQSTTDEISMFAKPSLVGTLTVNVQISSSLVTSCTLIGLSVDILVYDVVAFKAAYNNQFFVSGSTSTTISTSLTPFTISINDAAYMVGIYALTMTNPTKDPIDFKLSYSATTIQVTITNGGNTQEIFINYIQFETQPICIAPAAWNQTQNQCLSCSIGTYYDSTTANCTNCSSVIQYCIDCSSSTTCNTCGYLLSFIGGVCIPNCTYSQCTACSFSIATGIACDNCTAGYGISPQDQTLCITVCGDGIVMPTQQCDDANTINGDGCSALCIVEEYFSCTNAANSASQCLLLELSFSPLCIIKNQDSNSFLLVLQVFPQKLGFYSWVDWSKGIQPNPLLGFVSANYESQTSKLRLAFSYSSSIQDLTNIITISVSQITSQLSALTDKVVTLPQNTQNNQALQFFDDSFYKLAKVVRYVGYLIVALSLIMFLAGYFGTKLISIECIAVIQLAAMLVFSLKNTNPVMAAMQSLSLSMGLTCLPKDYKYEPSNLSPHMKLLMLSNNIFDCENISLMFLLCPLILALILKLLQEFKYKNKSSFKLAYKNSVGTFTFYAILLLAYGQVSYFVGNAKYFSSQANNYVTLVITLLFITLMVLYFIGFIKYPRWFGSFKNKFQKYNICEYFYLISTAERFITPLFLVAVSPFKYVSLIVFPIFVGEAVFIAYKKPYLQDTWKRPLANKIISAVICILFTIPAATQNQSYTQIVVALIIEIILLTVLSYSAYFTIKQFPQNMQQVKFKMLNAESKMELKDCQKKQLHDFAVKMIPTQYAPRQEDLQVDGIQTQNENEKSKFKGYWQNYYCHLYTGSILQNVLNMNRIHIQKSLGQNSISVEMKEMNLTKDVIQKIQ